MGSSCLQAAALLQGGLRQNAVTYARSRHPNGTVVVASKVESLFNCCLEVDVVWLGRPCLQAAALLQGGLRQSAVITRAAAIERNRHMHVEGR